MSRKRKKHLAVDAAEVGRFERLMRAETETDAIERALDFAISECKRDRLAAAANLHSLTSGIAIRDADDAMARRRHCGPTTIQ
jgi:hypothetical protein